MKENKLIVIIQKPLKYVFDFTTDPKNTSKWIENIEQEETNEWPIKLGTIYRNKDISDKFSEYVVTYLEKNKVFELASKDGNYHVRYTYRAINDGCELEYFEWLDEGNLDQPFNQSILDKLKSVIES